MVDFIKLIFVLMLAVGTTAAFCNVYRLYWLLMNGTAAGQARVLVKNRLSTGVWAATALKEDLEREIEERNQISESRKENKKYLLEEAGSRGLKSYVRDYEDKLPVPHLGIFLWVCLVLPDYIGFYIGPGHKLLELAVTAWFLWGLSYEYKKQKSEIPDDHYHLVTYWLKRQLWALPEIKRKKH